MSRIVVIGAGNPLRGDDAAGRLVADGLTTSLGRDVCVCTISGEGSELLAAMEGAEAAWVIDAACEQGAPGRIRRFDAAAESLPCHFFRHSTHAFGVAEGIEVARALGQLPRRLVVYAIEGRCFDAGAPCASEVVEAAWVVAARVHEEIGALTTPDTGPALRTPSDPTN